MRWLLVTFWGKKWLLVTGHEKSDQVASLYIDSFYKKQKTVRMLSIFKQFWLIFLFPNKNPWLSVTLRDLFPKIVTFCDFPCFPWLVDTLISNTWFVWGKIQPCVWDIVQNVNCNFRKAFLLLNLNMVPWKAYFGRTDGQGFVKKVVSGQPDGCNSSKEATVSPAASQKWPKFGTSTPKVQPKTHRYDQTNFIAVFWGPRWPYWWKEIH